MKPIVPHDCIIHRAAFLSAAGLAFVACHPTPQLAPKPPAPAPVVSTTPPPASSSTASEPVASPASHDSFWTTGPALVRGHQVFLYDLEQANLRATLIDPDRIPAHRVSVDPRQAHVMTLGADGTVTVYRTSDSGVVVRKKGLATPCPEQSTPACYRPSCDFYETWSPSGTSVLLAGPQEHHLVRLDTGESKAIACSTPFNCGSFSPDGEYFAHVNDAAHEISILRFPSFAPIQHFAIQPSEGNLPSWDSTSRFLAFSEVVNPAEVKYQTSVWEVASGRRLFQRKDLSASFAPHGFVVVGGMYETSLRGDHVVVDARSGAILARWSFSITTCGEGIVGQRDRVVVLDDSSIVLWDRRRGVRTLSSPLPNFRGDSIPHTSCESCGPDMLSLSPDGRSVATTRRIFDSSTGRERARLDWSCLAAGHWGWSSDGSLLALGGTPLVSGADDTPSERLIVAAFRGVDGSVVTKFETTATCGGEWVPGTHVLAMRPDVSLAYQLLRVDDGARLWLVPGVDRPIAAVSSTGDYDGTPEPAHVPHDAMAKQPCKGLVRRFLERKPCSKP